MFELAATSLLRIAAQKPTYGIATLEQRRELPMMTFARCAVVAAV